MPLKKKKSQRIALLSGFFQSIRWNTHYEGVIYTPGSLRVSPENLAEYLRWSRRGSRRWSPEVPPRDVTPTGGLFYLLIPGTDCDGVFFPLLLSEGIKKDLMCRTYYISEQHIVYGYRVIRLYTDINRLMGFEEYNVKHINRGLKPTRAICLWSLFTWLGKALPVLTHIGVWIKNKMNIFVIPDAIWTYLIHQFPFIKYMKVLINIFIYLLL